MNIKQAMFTSIEYNAFYPKYWWNTMRTPSITEIGWCNTEQLYTELPIMILKKNGTNPNSQGNKRFKFMISVFRWWLIKWRNCGSSSNFYIPHYFFLCAHFDYRYIVYIECDFLVFFINPYKGKREKIWKIICTQSASENL